MALGLGPNDVEVIDAWMARNEKSKILWVRLNPGNIKKLRKRAAVKRPQNFSLREYCPGVAIERKKELNKTMMNRKKKDQQIKWRVEIEKGSTDSNQNFKGNLITAVHDF